MRIKAALAGVDIEKSGKEVEKKKEENLFMFKSPEEYEHLSQKEREDLTQKMMGKHKEWAEGRKGFEK